MSKRFIPVLAAVTLLIVGGVAWTEFTHRPQTLVLPVKGMLCEGCATTVRESLEKLPGVSDIAVSPTAGEAKLTVDGWSKTTRDDVEKAIRDAGYEVASR